MMSKYYRRIGRAYCINLHVLSLEAELEPGQKIYPGPDLTR